MLKKNVGQLDRAIRLVAGGVLILLGLFPFGGLQGGATGVFIAIFGLTLLMTGLFGVCILYALLRFSTKKKEVM